MLDRDVVVLHPAGLLLGLDDRFGKLAGEVDLAGFIARSGHAGALAQLGFEGLDHAVDRDVHLGEQAWNQTVGLLQQRREQVLAPHLLVPEGHGLALRSGQRFARLLCELVHVHG